MKAGLSLSGGGARGAFEVGVLEYVAEHPDLYPDGFARGCGCSVGAVNLGGLVQFAPGSQQIGQFVGFMTKCWERLGKTEDVWTKRFPPFLAGLWNPSIGDNAPLRKLLGSLIDFKAAGEGTPCDVAAWDLLSGKGVYFALHEAKTQDELISFILASSSFPLAFPPEKVGDYYCTDGGIFDIAPVGNLIRGGCDHILAVVCRNPKHPDVIEKKNMGTVLQLGTRCLDGMESEVVRGDLEKVRLWNLLVEVGHPAAEGKKKIEMDVILPQEPLGEALDFSPALTIRRRKIGYETARVYFESKGRC